MSSCFSQNYSLEPLKILSDDCLAVSYTASCPQCSPGNYCLWSIRSIQQRECCWKKKEKQENGTVKYLRIHLYIHVYLILYKYAYLELYIYTWLMWTQKKTVCTANRRQYQFNSSSSRPGVNVWREWCSNTRRQPIPLSYARREKPVKKSAGCACSLLNFMAVVCVGRCIVRRKNIFFT